MKLFSRVLFLAFFWVLIIIGTSSEAITPTMTATFGAIFVASGVFSGLMNRGKFLSGLEAWDVLSPTFFGMSATVSFMVAVMWGFAGLVVTPIWAIILTSLFLGSWANFGLYLK